MSSILETFYILFKSNAGEVKAGADEAKKTTDDLEKKINSTNVAAKDLGKTFTGVVEAAGSALAGLLSLGALKANILQAAAYNNELSKQSQLLNLNAAEMSAWGGAVQAAGGSAEGFTASLKGLYSQYAQIGLGGRVAGVFDILPRLAERFERMSQSSSYMLGKRLGLDDGTIMLLQKGRREVETMIERQKELTHVTKADLEISRKFNTEWENTGKVFRSLFTTIGSDVLPFFTRMFTGIQDIVMSLREHKGFIYGFFLGLAAIMAYLAFPTLAAVAPFLMLAAAITAAGVAIGLIVDDIFNFMEGNESLLGSLLKTWPAIGELADWIVDKWKLARDFIFSSIEEMKALWESVKNIFDLTAGEGDINVKKRTEQVIFDGKKAVGIADMPLSSSTSNSITNSSNLFSRQDSESSNIQIGDVIIETQATDPDGIALGIKQSLGDQLRGLSARYDNAIAR